MGFQEPTSDPYNIVSKVKEHYCNQESKKHGIYLSISQDVLMKKRKFALFLRQKILKLCEVNFPNPITVEAIQYGQCPDVP